MALAAGHVENVAAAISLAATDEHAARRVYNVCEEPSFSELEWARKIAAAMRWDGDSRRHFPSLMQEAISCCRLHVSPQEKRRKWRHLDTTFRFDFGSGSLPWLQAADSIIFPADRDRFSGGWLVDLSPPV